MKISTRLLILAFLLASSPAMAGNDQTLSFYNPRGKFVYYHGPDLVMQAARFEIPSPGTIRRVTIMMGGDSAGHARLHLFGHEGGLPVPILEYDLITPIVIDKSAPGVVRVVVDLPTPILIPSNQFFIAVDALTPGVTLLSDNEPKKPSCADRADEFRYQFLKYADGNWRSAPYGYAITVTMEYQRQTATPALTDVTALAKLDDTVSVNRSIAWGDVLRGNHLDLLVNGRLYLNNGEGTFRDATEASGLGGHPRANAFIDADNDGNPDILFLGSQDSASPGSTLFVNDGHGRFAPHHLNIPRLDHVTSFGIADANGDGLLDIFVGEGGSASGDSIADHLLINDGRYGFIDDSTLMRRDGSAHLGSLGAEWIDYDNDGTMELFVVGEKGGNELWRRRSDGTYRNLLGGVGASVIDAAEVGGRGCDWIDYDNDGDVDLLLPASIGDPAEPARSGAAHPIYANEGSPRFDVASHESQSIEYEAKRMGGTWGDVNNDGLPDLVTTTSCGCRYMGLYLQSPGHGFEQKTFEYGLARVAAGPDAIWVDYDGDGKLDLATFVDGRFRLYRNTGATASNFLELDLADRGNGAGPIGSSVTVYAGGVAQTREVSSGRGLLMQQPFRLHFGLGAATRIDSVVVRWGGGDRARETLTGFAPNAIYRIGPGDAGQLASEGEVTMQASPNPFSGRLSIGYTLPADQQVRLEIYSMEGTLVTVLVEGKERAGGHVAEWDAVDAGGIRLPQGIYACRLKTGDVEIVRKVVLAR